MTHRWMKKLMALVLAFVLAWTFVFTGVARFDSKGDTLMAKQEDEVIKLRVCNWEEYIDLGDWGEEELIDLEDGTEIFGANSMVDDFEDWYYETYGKRVEVEYSCFGTNEDLYNMLTLGDVYDLVCPSDYMLMKLIAEDKVVPFSEEFFDESVEENYYVQGISPYIRDTFEKNEINGEPWSKYAAGYMWGVTGVLYNPEEMTEEEASTWEVFYNPDFARQITIKDNVRDSYFAALGAYRRDLLMSEEFQGREDYEEALLEVMNDVTPETIDAVEKVLQDMQDNVYSFETDSGKADIVSGKVMGNYQWSGDAVYAMDQAEEDDYYLEFAVPEESTNLWFDGWIMLKAGIGGDAEKQHAAEAFVNYLSRPDNVVRNMYYIGYTSVISGGEDDTVLNYLNWCYGAEDDEEEVVDYPLGYFFSGDNTDERYIIQAPEEQTRRQLFAQYPTEDVLHRSAIMQYFDEDATKYINQMWINVRCYNIAETPVTIWVIVGIIFVLILAVIVRVRAGHYRGE